MINLPEKFLTRMKSALGADFSLFLKSYDQPAVKGVRVNTLKISAEDFLKISPFPLERVEWEKSAFYAAAESLGKSVYHAAGLYYAQEPSACAPVPALGVQRGDVTLDLCAAPGGKSTQIAQYLGGEGLLVSNEINFPRAKILSQNIERLGVKNAVVVNAHPDVLCTKFAGFFDKVLVDAPCSGEGMFRKDPAAVSEWSEAAVKACAVRQRAVLQSAYVALAAGGTLVYSTCTFSPEEDEEQVEAFLSAHPDCTLLKTEKLYPHEVRGEGHFFAAIKKAGEKACDVPTMKTVVPNADEKVYRQWERDNLREKFGRLHCVDGVLYSLPENCPDLNGLRVLRAGVRLGEVSHGLFTPSHSLAMCLEKDGAPSVEVDEAEALKYLSGLTFGADGKGWKLAVFNGFPLGWCKVSDGVAKNRYPKGLRKPNA